MTSCKDVPEQDLRRESTVTTGREEQAFCRKKLGNGGRRKKEKESDTAVETSV